MYTCTLHVHHTDTLYAENGKIQKTKQHQEANGYYCSMDGISCSI